MSNETTVKVNVDVDTSSLEDLNSLLEQIQETGETIGDGIADSLDTATDSADGLSDSLSGVDGAPLDDVAGSADNLADSVDNATGEVDEMSAALGVIAGLGAGAAIDSMADSASNAEGTMRGLAAVMNVEPNTAAYDNLKNSISALSDASGLGKGEIRGMTVELGLMGIQNVDTASKVNEFATQISFLKNNSNDAAPAISKAIGALTMRDNLGALQLRRAGLNMETLCRVSGKTEEEIKSLWKTMSQEQRAEFLVQYGLDAGDVTAANENMEESYDALKDKAMNAWGGIMTTMGETVLPILIPALELLGAGLRGVRDIMGMLPDPVKGVMGVIILLFGAVVMAAGIFVGFLGILTKVDGVLRAVGLSFQFVGKNGMITGMLNSVKGALHGVAGAASKAATALLNVGKRALTAGLSAMRTVAMWLASAAAKSAAAISAAALAIAEWAVASPILVIIIVIAALIAILIYLYYNSEQVRNAINWLGEQIMALGQTIWNSLMNALNSFMSFLSFMATIPTLIGTYLAQIISRVISWGANMRSQIINTATNVVNGFISKVAGLPGKVGEEFTKILNKIKNIGTEIVKAAGEVASNLWKAFLNNLGIHSPGIIQIKTIAEFQDMLSGIEDEAPTAKRVGGKVASGLYSGYNQEFSSSSSNFANGSLINQIQNNGQNPQPIINLEIGSVDKQERIDEIVEAITKHLNWSNETAGRTV